MPELSKYNWVACPNCKFRYQIGAALLKVKDVPSICPRCRHEFDPRTQLDQEITAVTVRELY